MASQTTCQTAGSKRLAELMQERGMSSEELAFKLHVSYSTVMRWLSGRVAPPDTAARRLGEFFGVDWREFRQAA